MVLGKNLINQLILELIIFKVYNEKNENIIDKMKKSDQKITQIGWIC